MRRLIAAAALVGASALAACTPPVVGPPRPTVTVAYICLGPEHRNHYAYAVNASGWYILRGHDGDSYPAYLQPNNLLVATGLDPSDVLWQSGAEWPVEAEWLKALGGHRDLQPTPAPECPQPVRRV